jgi:hypothetical protein
LKSSRKQSNAPFVVGFVVVLVALVALVGGLIYFRGGIDQRSLPSNPPEYRAVWANYVPSDVKLFGFENYSLIHEYNSTFPLFETFLFFPDAGASVQVADIGAILTMVLKTPNETVDMAFLNPTGFSTFASKFASYNASAVIDGDNSMYYMRRFLNGTYTYGWLAIIPQDRAVAFAIGSTEAQSAIKVCLSVQQGHTESIISTLQMRQILYIAGGTDGHLSIGLQNFQGVITGAPSTATVVDAVGSQVEMRRIVQFNSTSEALSGVADVKHNFLSASTVVDYQSFVLETEYHPISQLVTYVRFVE